MRFFLDTEFIDSGLRVYPISIGIVGQDHSEYYAEFDDYPSGKLTPWHWANVVPFLGVREYIKPTQTIKGEIMQFIGNRDADFWCYYGAYDWVVMCQLFGGMLALPPNFTKHFWELAQLEFMAGQPHYPRNHTPHNALSDARWNMKLFNYCTSPLHIDEDYEQHMWEILR